MKKKTYLLALALFLTLGLVACGNDDNGDDAYENGTSEETDVDEDDADDVEIEDEDEDADVEETVDGPSHATSGGGIMDEERLIAVLSADSESRAWVAGLAADIVMEGPLYIEGEAQRHSAGEFTTTDAGEPVFSRKLGFYQRTDLTDEITRVPSGAWSLTVENGIFVDSPQAFFISDGPFVADVFADVHVNVPNFRLTGVRIHGDLIFANEAYMESATFQMWDSEIADVQDGEYEDSDLTFYRSSTGFGTIDSADATNNVSNVDGSELVTGEIRVAE